LDVEERDFSKSSVSKSGNRLDKVGAVGAPSDRSSEGPQLFQPGYVWRYAAGQSQVQQVRPVVMLAGVQAGEIVKVLQRLVGPSSEAITDPNQLEALYRKALEDLTGDETAALSIADAAREALGLEFSSGLLKKKPDQITALYEKERAELKMKMKRLEDVADDVYLDYEMVFEQIDKS